MTTAQTRTSATTSPSFGRGGLLAVIVAAALVAAPAGGEAQPSADEVWLPWLGCWTANGAAGELLCVRPSEEDGAVELLTLEDGSVTSTETLRADGKPLPVSREGCEGTESATSSDDGRRIYLASDLTCEGDVERRSTGIVAWVSPDEWIRVETVEVGSETAATVERYGPAPSDEVEGAGLDDIAAGRSMAVRSARMAAASRPSPDAVIEASREVHDEAVRAWVAERGDPLAVDAEVLTTMSEAGVADDVIDVVVAVSFPERFELDRQAATSGTNVALAGDGGYGDGYGYRSPFGYGSRYYGSPYGFRFLGLHRYGYGYSPFGYGSSRYRWPYGRRNPTIIIVRSDGGDDGGGRLVNGRGFVRNGDSDSRGTARRPSSSGIGGSSGGSISPAGATTGSSSGSTGRKAKKKGESSGGDGGSQPL